MLEFFGHPFSSYCQKALIAFYEKDIPFRFRIFGPEDEDAGREFAERWPVRRMPLLVDGARALSEATIIIEYVDRMPSSGPRLLPENPVAALDVRFLDRFFDNYVMTPMQKIVGDALRPADQRDPYGVDEARNMLDTAYGWLDRRIADREWIGGDGFSLADCSAAPSLFYADWAHPIGEGFSQVKAYRGRLLSRPSFARAVDEARPYRPFFPLGAPDRD